MKIIRPGTKPLTALDFHYECYICKGIYQPENRSEIRTDSDQRETMYYLSCPACGQERAMKRIRPTE